MFSLKTLSEVNCKNLSTRDIEFYTYKEKWEKEKTFTVKNQRKIGRLQRKVQVFTF